MSTLAGTRRMSRGQRTCASHRVSFLSPRHKHYPFTREKAQTQTHPTRPLQRHHHQERQTTTNTHPVSDPFNVSSNFTQRTIISVPTEPWERTPYGRTFNVRLSSNEGPEQLTSPITGQQFIIYSAARSDNPDYCLGQLSLVLGGDPMNPNDWTKSNGCVFYQNKREMAYGVGHASFVQSPDLSEWWMVYHGMLDPVTGWAARTIRAQQFTWAADGTPVFPRPGYGPYPVPAGQVGS